METSKAKVQQFLLQSIVPIVCSIIVGFIFNGWNVSDRHYGAFQFVWSGVVASVFYYLLVHARPRDAFLGFIFLFALTFLTTESSLPAFILRDIFYIGAIGVTMIVYFKYFRPDPLPHYAYPVFMLSGVYSIVYIAMFEIHFGILQIFAPENSGGNAVSVASSTAYYGVLIGFAVGAGIALNEKWSEIKKAWSNLIA